MIKCYSFTQESHQFPPGYESAFGTNAYNPSYPPVQSTFQSVPPAGGCYPVTTGVQPTPGYPAAPPPGYPVAPPPGYPAAPPPGYPAQGTTQVCAKNNVNSPEGICLSVCLGLLRLHYAPLQRYNYGVLVHQEGAICTTKAQYAPWCTSTP